MKCERELRCTSSQVVGGPMALVVSVQRLAPLLSTVLTSERPQVHLQHHHAGEPAMSHPHSWARGGAWAQTELSALL